MATKLEVYNSDGTLHQTVDGRVLSELKQAKNEEINAYRDQVLDAGFWALTHKWDSNERARTNVSGFSVAVLSGLPPPETLYWRDYDNVNVALTYADFEHMAQMLVLFNTQVYAASWVHKNAVDALTDPDDVENYDYTTGWPDGDTDGTKP